MVFICAEKLIIHDVDLNADLILQWLLCYGYLGIWVYVYMYGCMTHQR